MHPNDQPLGLHWTEAPKRTQWGAEMMEALVALGKDNTLRLYAEAEALHLVEPALHGAAVKERDQVREFTNELLRLCTALAHIERLTINALRTDSRDVRDWQEDVAYLGKLAKDSLTIFPPGGSK